MFAWVKLNLIYYTPNGITFNQKNQVIIINNSYNYIEAYIPVYKHQEYFQYFVEQKI